MGERSIVEGSMTEDFSPDTGKSRGLRQENHTKIRIFTGGRYLGKGTPRIEDY